VKYERDEYSGSYHIVNYNYRYSNNPFDIDEIYEKTKERPFITNMKGELEMLIMHSWIFDCVEDVGYWPEYVNLSIEAGRVNNIKNCKLLFVKQI
jgi:hypothetical protein